MNVLVLVPVIELPQPRRHLAGSASNGLQAIHPGFKVFSLSMRVLHNAAVNKGSPLSVLFRNTLMMGDKRKP